MSAPQGNEPTPRPVFLEREGYRRRRLIDAVRLLPVIGAFLWLVPLLWLRGGTPSSSSVIYIFGVWALLIALSGLLSRGVKRAAWRSSTFLRPGADEPADGAGGRDGPGGTG